MTSLRSAAVLILGAASLLPGWESTAQQGKYDFSNSWIQNNFWITTVPNAWQRVWWNSYDGANANFGWQWSWPDAGIGGVKGYPYVGTIWSSGLVPSRLGDRKNIGLEWSFWNGGSGGQQGVTNNAIDLWIMGDSNFASPAKAEVMIWWGYYSQYMTPSGTRQHTISIAGVTWEVWKGTEGDGKGNTWQYYAFRPASNMTAFDTNLGWFLGHLQDKNWLNRDWYLTQIHAGSEIVNGSGYVHTHRYRVYPR